MELKYEYVKPQSRIPVKKVSFRSEASVFSGSGEIYINDREITVTRDSAECGNGDVVFNLQRCAQEIYLNRSSIVALHKIFGDIIDGEGWERLE